MTTAELTALLEQRNDAWQRMGDYDQPIGKLNAAERHNLEAWTLKYHQAERAIVAHLQDNDGPVLVGTMVLHLTTDRQHFIELDKKTGSPVYANDNHGWKILLYRYPTKKDRKSA